MNVDQFIDLCRAMAKHLPKADTQLSESACELKINGIDISLFFNPLISGDRIHCYVEIGPAPDSDREAVFSHLLTLNLLSSTKTSGVYGFDPESKKLIFTQQIIYPELMDPEELATILEEYSIQANHLQQTLINQEASSPLSSALRQSVQTSPSFLA